LSPSDRSEVFIRLEGLSKSFEGNVVVDDVSLSLRSGEVHALMGVNGSGKSTLIKLLTGYHQADVEARAWVAGSPARLTAHGIVIDGGDPLPTRTLHQDLGLIGRLSVADNVGMITGYPRHRGGAVDWPEHYRRTSVLLRRVGAGEIDPRQEIDDCDAVQRTQVALARTLAGWDAREGLLILDEPTATLPEDQVDRLFATIRSLKSNGVCVLYVSHRLNEIFEIADRVSVLREGRRVISRATRELDRPSLVEFMVGPGNAPLLAPPQERGVSASAAVTVTDLSNRTLESLDFTVKEGEILGFAGLIGSGLQDLPYLLVGARRATSGRLVLGDRHIDVPAMTPRRAKRLGIGLLPADRKREGIIGDRSIVENITLPRIREFQRRGWLRTARERGDASSWVERLDVVPPEPDKEIGLLSGGNQQKVVLAKWLSVARSLFVLAEPTAGVDIHARERIYRALSEQRDRGTPIIVCSTDISDLVHTCDRVIALDGGRAVAEFTGPEITEDAILREILHGSADKEGVNS